MRLIHVYSIIKIMAKDTLQRVVLHVISMASLAADHVLPTCWKHLTLSSRDMMDEGLPVDILYFDFRKAFDTVYLTIDYWSS